MLFVLPFLPVDRQAWVRLWLLLHLHAALLNQVVKRDTGTKLPDDCAEHLDVSKTYTFQDRAVIDVVRAKVSFSSF